MPKQKMDASVKAEPRRVKLTKAVADRAQYPPDWDRSKNRAAYLWDTALPGFALRIFPSGKRSWYVTYRVKRSHAQRFMSIGRYPVLTATEAREKARQVLGAVAGGADPGAKAKADGMTVAKLADAYYEHHGKKKKSRYEIKRRIENQLKPALGGKRAVDIARRDVAALHAKIAERSVFEANRLLSLVSVVFRFATEQGHVPETQANPAKGISKLPEESRERVLEPDEAVRLLRAVDKEEAPFPDVIRLLLLTGARKSELLRLQWKYVDFENRTVTFTDRKGGGSLHLRPSPNAWEILERLKDERGTNPYVFPGPDSTPKEPTHLKDFRREWERARRRAGLQDVRVHDLRRTVGSWLGHAGVAGPAIQATLGHAHLTTSETYVRMHGESTEKPLAAIGGLLAEAEKKATSNSDTVIPLKRKS